MKLKINMWTAIFDIVNCILFVVSWFVIAGTAVMDATSGTNATGGTGTFFYIMAWIGVALNIWALVASKKNNISIVGPVLGIIGSTMFGVTAAMAFPALVVLIIATVFTFLQHPTKGTKQTN